MFTLSLVTSRYHSDHLGSSTVVTNSSGDVLENTTYSPFGEIVTGGAASRYGYEGKEFDSVVGDTDFHFRKYKAEWGIFLQPDTLLPTIYDPQKLNRYMFERANPYKYTDPDGHAIQIPAAVVIGAILAYKYAPSAVNAVLGVGYAGLKWYNKDEKYENILNEKIGGSFEKAGSAFAHTPTGWLDLGSDIKDFISTWKDVRDANKNTAQQIQSTPNIVISPEIIQQNANLGYTVTSQTKTYESSGGSSSTTSGRYSSGGRSTRYSIRRSNGRITGGSIGSIRMSSGFARKFASILKK